MNRAHRANVRALVEDGVSRQGSINDKTLTNWFGFRKKVITEGTYIRSKPSGRLHVERYCQQKQVQ